jgi:hypothetical protein
MKKRYEAPIIEIEEFEIENTLGNVCNTSPGNIPGDEGGLPD